MHMRYAPATHVERLDSVITKSINRFLYKNVLTIVVWNTIVCMYIINIRKIMIGGLSVCKDVKQNITHQKVKHFLLFIRKIVYYYISFIFNSNFSYDPFNKHDLKYIGIIQYSISKYQKIYPHNLI